MREDTIYFMKDELENDIYSRVDFQIEDEQSPFLIRSIDQQLNLTLSTHLDWFEAMDLFNFLEKHLKETNIYKTRNRAYKYADFLELEKALPNDRCRIVANILYFGDDLFLDDVISLSVEDIDFISHRLFLRDEWLKFPCHIFLQIKEFIGAQRTGKIFTGRSEAAINPSTIFRSFKMAGAAIGNPDICPKDLTEKLIE